MKKKFVLLAIFSLGYFTSCQDFVSKDDVSPNEPGAATLNTLLPVIEIAIYASHTGSNSRNSSMFIQHTAGTQFQSNDYNRYILTETDVSNDWQTIYNSGFVNCNQLISQAGDNNPRYRGIAKVCKAMFLGLATDFWGDVPNTQAGLGQANLEPVYDKQETVIAAIQSLLSEAVVDLAKSDEQNANMPTTDDFLFGGDGESWIKSAYILKARYANRISKRDPNAAAMALQYVDSAMAHAAGSDMYARFSSAANELNPWYSFNDQRADYMKMSATLIDTLAALSDPRLGKYAGEDVNGGISGAPNGSVLTDFSYVGDAFAGIDASLPLVTMFEAYFIEAEAAMRVGNETRAVSAFNSAVTANMAAVEIGSSAVADYLANAGNISAATDKMGMIMFQKWIAMFTQPEAWADWRRTGMPALTPNPKGVIDEIPKRYPTEQRERINNRNATVVSDLVTPVWWSE